MTSRLLDRFNTDIMQAPSAYAADCLRAQRAAYQARLGAFERVDAEIVALRRRYAVQPQTAISAWVNFAEGVRSHATDLSPVSRDKIQRAYALSAAAGLKSLQALSAAWLGHMAYLRMDPAALARYVGEALQLAEPDDHATRSRATLVVAQALDEAGEPDLARSWYDLARQHATTEGDDATLSAMMWNMAMLRLRDVRQLVWQGRDATAARERARLSAASIERFDGLLGSQSMQSLHPLLRAQLLTERGAYEHALALFSGHLNEALRQGMVTITATLLADRAWCRLQLGELAAAQSGAHAAIAQLPLSVVAIDCAPAYGRLAQLFEALGQQDEAGRYRALADAAWRSHGAVQSQLSAALTTMTPFGPAA